MSYTYANNVRCALDSNGIDSTAVTFGVVTPSAPFTLPPTPATISRLTLVDNLYAPTKLEIITYTGRSGNTISGVTRAQEGTTAQAFATGYAYQAATAADYSAFSALTDVTPIGILGTGEDSTFDSQDALTISHSTLSSDSRFKRIAAVYEKTAGSSSTDSTMDFDYADIANYTRDTESPNATITPSATANTYSNKTFGTGTTATYSVGRVTSANYRIVYQVFKGPAQATGFTVYLGANTNTPTGDIGYKLIKVPAGGDHYIHWASCPVVVSGQFTPSASATNNITFGSTAYLDDNWYAIVLYCISAQDGDSDFYNIGNQATSIANAYGASLQYAAANNSIDAQPAIITAINAQCVMTLTAGTVNAGVTLTISGDYWYPTDIGKTVRGNSGHFLISGLTDLCTGGTALSGAGTAANAFDGDIVTTSCAAGTNGYVGYDFGSSKTIRGVGVMFADASYNRILDLIIEVSDDNFTGSTTVLNPAVKVYQNRCWYYFDITSPTAGRYIRIRETGGAALTVQEMECFDGTTALTHLHVAAFANTNAITSGNWTLSGEGWGNGQVYQEGGTSALIAPVTSSTFSTIDAIASALSYGGPHLVGMTASSAQSNISSNTSGRRRIAKLDTDKYVVLYMANSSADGYAVIVTIDANGAATFGAPTAFVLGGSIDARYIDVCALSSTLFVIGYTSSLRACSVSGTTITIGSSVANTANGNAGGMSLCRVDATRFLCTGLLVTSTYPASVCGSISGTTITLGSKVDLGATGSSSSDNCTCCTLYDTDKVFAIYSFTGSETTLRGKILSLTGTSIAAGAEATATINASTGLTVGSDNIIKFGSSIVFCNSWAGTGPFQAIAATVSGTTITFGTATSVMIDPDRAAKLFAPTSSRLWVMLQGVCVPISVSGTTITVGSNRYVMLGNKPGNAGMVASSFVVMAGGNTYLAEDRANAVVMKGTSQGDILIGPSLSVSFNAATYYIWNGSAARAIASSATAIHGGTDGVWYYRNAASVWAAATTNSAIGALKQATVYPANCMSMEEMKAMSSANWTTLGFVEANTTTYFAFVWSSSENTRYLIPNTLDQLSLTYTSRPRWDQLTQNYIPNMGDESSVTITTSTAGTKWIKAVVTGPSA